LEHNVTTLKVKVFAEGGRFLVQVWQQLKEDATNVISRASDLLEQVDVAKQRFQTVSLKAQLASK
jgi:hypothetical protein